MGLNALIDQYLLRKEQLRPVIGINYTEREAQASYRKVTEKVEGFYGER
jgi:hypothetical protein